MKSRNRRGRARTLARLLAPFALLALAAGGHAQGTNESPVVVFAAASLADALEDLSARWAAQGHAPLKLALAASSTLARQIENGAAADIYVAADEEWMDYLATRGFVATSDMRSPIGNTLVLVAPRDEYGADPGPAPEIDRRFDLPARLGAGRLAVGDPAHVPAGRYARQALESMNWWTAVEPRLARAENVRAALALVERGEAPFGIVYATDARISRHVRVIGRFPHASHDPIRYVFAVLGDRDSARVGAAFEFLTGPRAREAYAARGFTTE